ncbi:oligopeptide transporter 4 [Actinidia rufa]|uniref:Oligopeptide transporter 4 n=1 Tax=Actinidia rufa TaxID=165716 RepID=A0A7J0EVT8_9ERIC|nr:oligopeptide transporter 4 [Actinidia rufa]
MVSLIPYNQKHHAQSSVFTTYMTGPSALHEKDESRMSRAKFFLIALFCSFSWYLVPGYLFTTLSSISWICWAFSKSVTAQQIGSGMRGLGLGALTLDWTVVASFLFSPLICPFFSIVNVFLGYTLIMYIVIPISYWGLDVHGAKKFPIFSSHLFTYQGQRYNISAIVNNKFEIDMVQYQKQGRINLSMFFSLTYGFGFATIASTLTHVALFYGREIYERFRASYKGKEDIHTRLMRKYKDIPSWWFHVLLGVTIAVSLVLCIFMNDQVQMPWWGLLFASVIAFIFTLPISVITATTNQFIGTIIAGTVNILVAWWQLTSIENICQDDLLPPDSPWTCPGDRVFFDASVIWGLVGPKRIFGSLGNYSSMNWFFLGGAMGPVFVWLFHKAFPKQSWIPLINLPVLLGATAYMPPATAVNYNSWILVGTIFNFFIFPLQKEVVAKVQLRSFGSSGCRGGFHGCATILSQLA